MRALALVADRKLELRDLPAPPPPGAGEVQIRVKAVGAQSSSTCGAFAAWPSPSASCRSSSAPRRRAKSPPSAPASPDFKPGDPVVMYGALTCGTCKACREGRDNLCENVGGIMGFHVDGFARELINMPARLVIPVPKGVSMRDAACAPIAFSTVEHMLFDNAKLQPGETILVHAGGSGIGTVAIKMAKAIGCTVITTVGDDAKAEKAKALGADHVINYRKDRFEGAVRKLTAKKGVDVVFEHVGGEGFNGSLLVPQARRPARHLRLDRGTDRHHQPDAAVPAAIQNLRFVRRVHAQHPRRPRQDGRRPDAGDRHRGPIWPISNAGWRAWKAGRCSEKSS